MEQKSDADILAEAREYIEEHGWVRGELRNERTGRVCSMGGIVFSQGWYDGDLGSVSREVAVQLDYLCGLVARAAGAGDCANDLVEWNDHKAEEAQQILDAFAKAEKIERTGFDPDAA